MFKSIKEGMCSKFFPRHYIRKQIAILRKQVDDAILLGDDFPLSKRAILEEREAKKKK